MKPGTFVAKNRATWVPNAFDAWGRGVGVGRVVESPIPLDPGQVDVRWPSGRCFELVEQLEALVMTVEEKVRAWLDAQHDRVVYDAPWIGDTSNLASVVVDGVLNFEDLIKVILEPPA